jgi:hypothetical protein
MVVGCKHRSGIYAADIFDPDGYSFEVVDDTAEHQLPQW